MPFVLGSDWEPVVPLMVLLAVAVPTRMLLGINVALAITEISHYGVVSAQVCRRLRALLEDLRDDVAASQREAIEAQLRSLSLAISQAWPEPAEQAFARTADRQGIGEGGRGTVATR